MQRPKLRLLDPRFQGYESKQQDHFQEILPPTADQHRKLMQYQLPAWNENGYLIGKAIVKRYPNLITN